MYKDRVINVDKYRPFAATLGSLKGIRNRFDSYVTKEEVLDVSSEQAKSIKTYMDAMSEDVSSLKLVDLFDPEFLDSDIYDDGLVFTQHFYIDMRNSVKLLNELQISPNRTVTDINECNRVVSNEILQNAMLRLVTDYQEAVTNQDFNHIVIDTLEEATRDQVVQIVTPDFYLRELGVDVPENLDEIFTKYEDEYNEFVDARVKYILSSVMDDIEKPVPIVVSNVTELKETLLKIFDEDDFRTYLNEVDTNLFITDIKQILNKTNQYMAKLDTQAVATVRQTVMNAYMKFSDANKLGDYETQEGKRPIRRTIALVDIIIHAFVLASADIWDVSKETEDDLDATTKYIVELINAEISERLIGADEDISVSDYTAYKMLSAVSVAIDLVISRNLMLRWRMNNGGYGTAMSALQTLLLQRFKPEAYEEQQKALQEYFARMQQQQMQY